MGLTVMKRKFHPLHNASEKKNSSKEPPLFKKSEKQTLGAEMSNPIRKLISQTAVYGLSSIVGRLLKPEARKDIIEFFEKENIVPTAMMDISDGLSSEVLHICKQSGVGAVLYEDKLPVHPDAKEFAYKLEDRKSVV